jgi:hypothetical protein
MLSKTRPFHSLASSGYSSISLASSFPPTGPPKTLCQAIHPQVRSFLDLAYFFFSVNFLSVFSTSFGGDLTSWF